MGYKLKEFFNSLIKVEKQERLKLLLLTAAFFLVIGAYTLVKELKDSIFVSVVGKEYVPWARIAVMFILIPAILFYSFLVDKMRRYQLLCFYSVLYGIMGFVCIYLVGHPTIGIANTDTSPYRLFGWFFYFFIEGFSPFVVSVFWAFSNSVYGPEEAKNNYALLVSGSKIGGMLTAGFAMLILGYKNSLGCRLCTDVLSHQLLLGIFSLFVLCIPFVIYLLIKKVPGRYLHGYEAVYQVEKEKSKEEQKPNILSGLVMLIKWPYILGIFGMLVFYETVQTVLSYQRLGLARSLSPVISDMSYFLFKVAFLQHLVGFFISFVGTRALLNRLGERICLLLIPISTGLLLFLFLANYTPNTLIIVLILLRSINYAFAQPVRESLYIPTIKDMKFKSKSWVDAFGGKFAKGFGSSFNAFSELVGSTLFFPIHTIFFTCIVIVWTLTAYLLGNRFNQAIARNEVIGIEDEQNTN